MSLAIYDASIPPVLTALKCLGAVLKKTEAYAKEREIKEDVILGQSLRLDMFPLSRQVMVVTDNAKGIAARLAGVDVPSYPDDETTFEQLQARIEKTARFVGSLDRAAFDGAESKDVVLKLGSGEYPFIGKDYLFQFGLPNLYFHCATAYGICRYAGVELSKFDFLRPPGA